MTQRALLLCASFLFGCTASSKNEVCDVDRDCLPGYRCSVSPNCSASRVCGATDYRCVAVPGDLAQGAPDLLQPLADLSGAAPDLQSPAPSERWDVFKLPGVLVAVADLWGQSSGAVFALSADPTGRKFEWQADTKVWAEVQRLGGPGRSLFMTQASFFVTLNGSLMCTSSASPPAQFADLLSPPGLSGSCAGLLINSVAVRGAPGDPSVAYFLQSTASSNRISSWTEGASAAVSYVSLPSTPATNALWVVDDTLLYVGGATTAYRVQNKVFTALPSCAGAAAPGGIWASDPQNLWVVGNKTIWSSNGLDGCTTITPPGAPSALTRVFGHSASAVWIAGGPAYLAFWDGNALAQVTLPTAVQTALGSATFTAIWGVSQHDLWFGTNNGVILHRTFK